MIDCRKYIDLLDDDKGNGITPYNNDNSWVVPVLIVFGVFGGITVAGLYFYWKKKQKQKHNPHATVRQDPNTQHT